MLDAAVSTPQSEVERDRPCIRLPRWAVLATYGGAELWAETNLRQRGYQPYLPLYATMQRDRVTPSMRHYALKPLWPGYIFCRHTPGEPWRPIRYCPGVRANLLGGKAIQYAPEAAVEAVRAGEALRRLPVPEKPVWAPGAPCSLATGQSGVVLSVSPSSAVVLTMMFGALREATVSLDCLKPRDA
jgi:hypothetical protein